MIELIKKSKAIIAVVLIILALVLLRNLNGNHFQTDSKKWAEASVTGVNILTPDKAQTLSGDILSVCLDRTDKPLISLPGTVLFIAPDSILAGIYINQIRNHTGSVLLFSRENATAARIWMILSQMGFRNLYIITDESDNEVFKNKFRPDTLTRPEL